MQSKNTAEPNSADYAAVSVYPEIVRDANGIVERRQMIVTVDIVPEGAKFRLNVATTSSHPAAAPKPPNLTP